MPDGSELSSCVRAGDLSSNLGVDRGGWGDEP